MDFASSFRKIMKAFIGLGMCDADFFCRTLTEPGVDAEEVSDICVRVCKGAEERLRFCELGIGNWTRDNYFILRFVAQRR